jgi:hypothetical protein
MTSWKFLAVLEIEFPHKIKEGSNPEDAAKASKSFC